MPDNSLVVLERQLAPLAPRFAQVLPANISPDRLIRTVMVSIERLPKLLECDRQSILNSAMSAAILGLEVDGVTGQAYLIPFKGKAQLVVGYKGYNTLAARAGITITGAVVREGDDFDFELGDQAFVKHKPRLGNKGRIIGAWACALSKGRPPVVNVMGVDDIMAIKARSPGGSRSDSPWNDPAIGFPAMAEKTVKRRLARSLPLNIMQVAARLDEAVDEQGQAAWISPDKGVIVDAEIIEPSPTPSSAQLIEHSPTPQPQHPSPAAATAPASGSQADAGAFSSHPPSDAAEPAASDSASRPAPATEAAGVHADRISEMSAAETTLRNAAESGWDVLKREWSKLPQWMRDDASMVTEKEKLKVRAAEVDKAREGK
jgi:recombination protein RecT